MAKLRFQKLMAWVVAVLTAFSFSVLTGACVFETDDDAVPVETEEEEGAEVETEVEVEDEETP